MTLGRPTGSFAAATKVWNKTSAAQRVNTLPVRLLIFIAFPFLNSQFESALMNFIDPFSRLFYQSIKVNSQSIFFAITHRPYTAKISNFCTDLPGISRLYCAIFLFKLCNCFFQRGHDLLIGSFIMGAFTQRYFTAFDSLQSRFQSLAQNFSVFAHNSKHDRSDHSTSGGAKRASQQPALPTPGRRDNLN